jgi:quercetin dioxygenase-like cupin family protein
MANEETTNNQTAVLPLDDLCRAFTLAGPAEKAGVHIGLAGDTYTILLTGEHTGGRFSLIDMYVPPGGGPPPHRHDFEETFIVLQGELEATCRGETVVVHAGETINIPANAPHHFQNASSQPTRMLCICSPAGQEKFFLEVGVRVATSTTPPPALDAAAQTALQAKARALAPRYRTEFLEKG